MATFRSLQAALLAVATSATLWGVTALAQVDAGDQPTLAMSSASVDANNDAFVARLSRRASREIADARTALRGHDTARAADLAQQAALAVDRIRMHLPEAPLRAQIRLLEREIAAADHSEITPRFALIYSDLAQSHEPLPIARAMDDIDNARRAFEYGDREAAAASLRLADRALIDTELDPPLAQASRALSQALADLHSDHVADADRELRRAAVAVDLIAGNVESPARRARLSIWQATRDYAAGLFDDARADLHRGAQALDEIASRGDAATREHAATLAHDTRQVADAIGRQGTEAVHGSQQAIDHLWTRTVALAERAGIQTYLEAKKLETTDPLARQLIDAQLHLSYARIDRTTLDNPQAAQRELALSRGDLVSAIAHAGQPLSPSVKALDDELQALLGGLAVGTAPQIDADRLRYDLASADLQQLEGSLQ